MKRFTYLLLAVLAAFPAFAPISPPGGNPGPGTPGDTAVIGTAAFDATGGEITNLVVKGIVENVGYPGSGQFNISFTEPAQADDNFTAAIVADPAKDPVIYYTANWDTGGFSVIIKSWDGAAWNNYDAAKIRVTIFRLP